MRIGGKGFLLFARLQPDTPGKLHAHSLSYEALELSSYELLIRAAEFAEEPDVANGAEQNARDERAMMEWLEARTTPPSTPRSRQSAATTSTNSSASTSRTRTRSRSRGSLSSSAGRNRGQRHAREHLRRPPRRDARPRGGDRGAARRARRRPVDAQGRRVRLGGSTGARSSRPTRTRRANSPRSRARSSTSRSAATNSSSGLPSEPATTRPRVSSSESSPRSVRRPRGSPARSRRRLPPH